MKPHIQELCDWLEARGATVQGGATGGKHYKIYFTYMGKEQFYVTALTPSDHRAQENAISTLRHMLGLVETEKRVGKRRVRKDRAPKPPLEVPTISAGKDWQAQLYGHPHAKPTPQEINAAWIAFWRNCMAAVGARSRL